MKEIVQTGNPVLREKSAEVPLADITRTETQALLREMHEALVLKEHGVALAAPQIGVSKRIFVVSPKIFEEEARAHEHLVYINPEIIKTSKKTYCLEEGCLSVEGRFGIVERAQQVTVRAYDEHGKPFTRGASELLAQIFQHEIDHLNGILYTDHALETHKLVESEK